MGEDIHNTHNQREPVSNAYKNTYKWIRKRQFNWKMTQRLEQKLHKGINPNSQLNILKGV